MQNTSSILSLLLLIFLFSQNTSFLPSDSKIKMDIYENLNKNGYTIHEGIIINKEDANQIKKERLTQHQKLFYYGDKITQKMEFSLESFQMEKQSLLDELSLDKEISIETKSNILKLIRIKEKTINYYNNDINKQKK